MLKRLVPLLAFCSSASIASAPPDPSSCIRVDRIVEGTVAAIKGDKVTLRVKRVLLGTYKGRTYTDQMSWINDDCSTLGPLASKVKVGDRLIVYSKDEVTGAYSRMWLTAETAYRFDPRLRAAYPDLQRQEASALRMRDERRRAERSALSREVGGAIPQGLTSSWVTDDDYPQRIASRGVQGLVRVRLDVTSEGRARACTVVVSNGDRDLDDVTCTTLIRRARYKPPESAEETTSTLEHD
jgi:TonB family protein